MPDRRIDGISESVSRIRGKVCGIRYFSDFWNHCWAPSFIEMVIQLVKGLPNLFKHIACQLVSQMVDYIKSAPYKYKRFF
jgi:hypothetical protein